MMPRTSACVLVGSPVNQRRSERKKSTSSSGLMNFEYVCVPGVTRRRTSSARVIVRSWESGVRAIVERKR